MLTVVVYVFQVLARTVGRRRRDLYTLIDDLWSWDSYDLYYDMTRWMFMPCFGWKYFLLKFNKNMFKNFRCYRMCLVCWFNNKHHHWPLKNSLDCCKWSSFHLLVLFSPNLCCLSYFGPFIWFVWLEDIKVATLWIL